MKRKITCDRKSNTCFLSPTTPDVLYGRGGILPIGSEFLIPVRSMSSSTSKVRKQKGTGKRHKRRTKSNKPVSVKKSTAKAGSHHRRRKRKH